MLNNILAVILVLVNCAQIVMSAQLNTWQPLLQQQRAALYALQQQQHTQTRMSNDYIDNCRSLLQTEQNNALELYNIQFAQCKNNSEKNREEIIAQSTAHRQNTTQRRKNACEEMLNCDDENDALAFYNCFANATNQAALEINALSTDSALAAYYLNYQIQNVTYYEELCFANCHNQYMHSLNDAMEKFKECLNDAPLAPTLRPPPIDDAAITAFNAKSTFKLLFLLLCLLLMQRLANTFIFS